MAKIKYELFTFGCISARELEHLPNKTKQYQKESLHLVTIGRWRSVVVIWWQMVEVVVAHLLFPLSPIHQLTENKLVFSKA